MFGRMKRISKILAKMFFKVELVLSFDPNLMNNW